MCPKEREKTYARELIDEVCCILDGGDVLGVVLLDGDLELLLERHDDLHGVQRVGAEVRELGLGRQRRRRVRAQRQLLLHDVHHLAHRLRLGRVDAEARCSYT